MEVATLTPALSQTGEGERRRLIRLIISVAE
jgi:hypothetical protein